MANYFEAIYEVEIFADFTVAPPPPITGVARTEDVARGASPVELSSQGAARIVTTESGIAVVETTSRGVARTKVTEN